MKYKILLLLVVLLATITSCGGNDEPTATPVPPTPTVVSATATSASPTATPVPPAPTPKSAPVSPLAAPKSPLAAPKSPLASPQAKAAQPAGAAPTLPKPAPGKTTFAGHLIAQFGKKTELEAVVLCAVYLAPVVIDKDKKATIASLDIAHDPNSSTDDNGYFVFKDVAPGQYGFIVFYDFNYYLIRDDAGKQVLMTITANQVKNIGDIKTKLPE